MKFEFNEDGLMMSGGAKEDELMRSDAKISLIEILHGSSHVVVLGMSMEQV
jgi:hypothetical protein